MEAISKELDNISMRTAKVARKTPNVSAKLAVTSAVVASGVYLWFSSKRVGETATAKTKLPSLEQQFGTADGYFPSATKGALLSNPPGNKERVAGVHYPPLSLRRGYDSRRRKESLKI